MTIKPKKYGKVPPGEGTFFAIFYYNGGRHAPQQLGETLAWFLG
jgi:hypothetical protein